jgi:hypothetical protein
MAAIYAADVWCDDCADRIRDDIANDMWDWNVERARNECPDGTPVSDFNSPRELNDYLRGMNESDYDSGEYPKWCSDDEESDCPQHCADCGYFFGNSLTSEGADYVI